MPHDNGALDVAWVVVHLDLLLSVLTLLLLIHRRSVKHTRSLSASLEEPRPCDRTAAG